MRRSGLLSRPHRNERIGVILSARPGERKGREPGTARLGSAPPGVARQRTGFQSGFQEATIALSLRGVAPLCFARPGGATHGHARATEGETMAAKKKLPPAFLANIKKAKKKGSKKK